VQQIKPLKRKIRKYCAYLKYKNTTYRPNSDTKAKNRTEHYEKVDGRCIAEWKKKQFSAFKMTTEQFVCMVFDASAA